MLAMIVVLGAGGRAIADEGDARAAEASLMRGQQLFNEGRYGDAIDELRKGYAINPQPRFLYALGQAYRLGGRCGEALEQYRAYLLTHPTSSQVAATEQNIQRCTEEHTTPETGKPESVGPEKPDGVAVTPAAAPGEVVVEHAPPARKPLYKRWWLWTAVTLGVAAGVGFGLGLGLKTDEGGFRPTLPLIGPGK